MEPGPENVTQVLEAVMAGDEQAAEKLIYVGLDVHKESIVVGTAPEGDTSVELYGRSVAPWTPWISSSGNWINRRWNCVLFTKPGPAVMSFIGT
jgi:hypothetical protein